MNLWTTSGGVKMQITWELINKVIVDLMKSVGPRPIMDIGELNEVMLFIEKKIKDKEELK